MSSSHFALPKHPFRFSCDDTPDRLENHLTTAKTRPQVHVALVEVEVPQLYCRSFTKLNFSYLGVGKERRLFVVGVYVY